MRSAGLGSSAPASKRRRQTRDSVLDAALKLFSERGYLGVRVEDIAQEAGVSRATFYKHFAEREQVLAELFGRLLGPDVPEPHEPIGDGAIYEKIMAVVEKAVRRMLEQEQLAKFVYSLPVRHSALLNPGAPTPPPVFGQVARLLEVGAERGEVRTDLPVVMLTRHVLAAMETAMRDWAEERTDDPVHQVRSMLGLALHGVGTP